jgi:type II secretory pathway pseudopilin PulG
MQLIRRRGSETAEGFTLLELIWVAGIIGLLIAIIVPRAIRARVTAKYTLVSDNCVTLGSFAAQWAEKSIQAQSENTSTARLPDYYASLVGQAAAGTAGQGWVADQGNNNWWSAPGVPGPIGIAGRNVDTVGNNLAPEDTVAQLITSRKAPTNPFNGVNVFFSQANLPGGNQVVPGAIALGYVQDANNIFHFSFVFQGTDSSSTGLNQATSFHSGQNITTLQGLNNGVFMAELR